MSWNVTSIKTREGRRELEQETKTIGPDIIFLQETRLTNKNSLRLTKKRIFRCDKGVGTAIAVRGKLNAQRTVIPNLATMDATAVVVRERDKKILLVSLYIKCNSRVKDLEEDLVKIKNESDKFDDFIIGGDLNARHASWNVDTEDNENSIGTHIKQFLDDHPQWRMLSPNENTFRNSSKLDHFITSERVAAGAQVKTWNLGRDHSAISLQTNLIKPNATKTEWRRDLKRTNWPNFKAMADQEFKNWSPQEEGIKSEEEIEEAINKINATIIKCLDASVKKVKVKIGTVNPLDPEIIKEMNIRKQALKEKSRKNISPEWRNLMKETVEEKGRLIKKMIRMQEERELREKIQTMNEEQNPFASLRRLKGRSEGGIVDSTIASEGRYAVTPEDKAEVMASFYEKLYKEKVPENQRLVGDIGNRISQWQQDQAGEEVRIGAEETEELRKSLNNKKSAGEDEISNYLMRRLPSEPWRVIREVLNLCWEMRYFPRAWKKAIIVPLKKKPNASEPKEFRPISMLANMGKLLEQTIIRRLGDGDVGWNQFAYRRSMGTANAIDLLKAEMREAKRTAKDFAVCALDAEKAFDSVWKEGLLAKVIEGCETRRVAWMVKSFMEDRRAVVRVGEVVSREIKIERGVPQGSKLGPCLFNWYTSGVGRTEEPNRGVIKYADDCLLWARGQPAGVKKAICKMYKDVKEELSRWNVNLNESKTEYLVICKRKKKDAYEGLLKSVGVNVERRREIKYLGTIISDSGGSEEAVKHGMKKGGHAFGNIKWILRMTNLEERLKKRLYTQVIRPAMTYGCEGWHDVNKTTREELERKERQLIRIMLGERRDREGKYARNETLYDKMNMKCDITEWLMERQEKFLERREMCTNERYVEKVKELARRSEEMEAVKKRITTKENKPTK